MPRVKCPAHGVHQVEVPWARKGSAFTLLFEQAALALVREMPLLAAARLMGITDTRRSPISICRIPIAGSSSEPTIPDSTAMRSNGPPPSRRSSTTGNIHRQIAQRVIGPRESWIDNAQVHEDDQSFYTAMLPILVAGGRDIGGIMVIRDVTTLQEDLRRSLISVAIVILLAGTLVFAFCFSPATAPASGSSAKGTMAHAGSRKDATASPVTKVTKPKWVSAS